MNEAEIAGRKRKIEQLRQWAAQSRATAEEQQRIYTEKWAKVKAAYAETPATRTMDQLREMERDANFFEGEAAKNRARADDALEQVEVEATLIAFAEGGGYRTTNVEPVVSEGGEGQVTLHGRDAQEGRIVHHGPAKQGERTTPPVASTPLTLGPNGQPRE